MKDQEERELLFDLEKVGHSYTDNCWALKNISFQVYSGESLVLLGPNGCGKSTLLSLLDALFYPTQGVIRAFGQELTEELFNRTPFASFFRRKVGFVFQNSDVQLFCPTVREEIAFGPLQLDLDPKAVNARIDELFSLLGLSQFGDRSPFSLSGGEKRKVAIASVLAINPSILLLDEPTIGLDPRTQVWMLELLEELHQAGKTLITATHDLSIVDEIADRVIVLDENHFLRAEGPATEILENSDLLLEVNLIHEHAHFHGSLRHIHKHGHTHGHLHDRT